MKTSCNLVSYEKFNIKDHFILLWGILKGSILNPFSVLRPDWPLLFHSMKSKQKSCQNEPSAGRFDGPRTRFDLPLTEAIIVALYSVYAAVALSFSGGGPIHRSGYFFQL